MLILQYLSQLRTILTTQTIPKFGTGQLIQHSYLFFEITTFHFLSVFFSKPAELFSQEVTLTLSEDCVDADDKMFMLLTQRVCM